MSHSTTRSILLSLLVSITAIPCVGCRQWKMMHSIPKVIPSEAGVSNHLVLHPLKVDSTSIEAVGINDVASSYAAPARYRDLLWIALSNFRHPLGLHETRFGSDVSGPEECNDQLILLLPPGLNRLQQLVFLEELEKYIASFRSVCHDISFAAKLDEIAQREAYALNELSSASQKRLDQREISWLEMEQIQQLIHQAQAKELQRELRQSVVPTTENAKHALLPFLDNVEIAMEELDIDPPPLSLSHGTNAVQVPTQNITYRIKKLEFAMLHRSDRSQPTSSRWPHCFQPKRVVSSIPNTAHEIALDYEHQLVEIIRIVKEAVIAAKQGSLLLEKQIEASRQRMEKVSVAMLAGEATRIEQLKVELQFLTSRSNFVLHSRSFASILDELARLEGTLFSLERISFPNSWLPFHSMADGLESHAPSLVLPDE